ncbi:MAG: methyltransferase domain-containing protein [Proteobacteria bacterium]|nr:methyltransferase domain-containing protein [Pseudomonadota bacterium]MBU1640593.1 methyltransferase domain-containing protein [Pseudomonadota bacterium]
MESKNLSEKTQKVLKRIRKQFKVGFNPLKIQDLQLDILQVNDLEHLLAGKDPFENVSEFPFWVKLWEASMVLAHVMASMPAKGKQTLLELGAGMAAPGLVAAARGYKVTLSDYEPHILDFQRVSAAANGFDDIEFRMIDWLKPPEMPKFDRIIGAEILFRDEFFGPLLAIFNEYLKDDGEIYLAHDVRRKSVPKFLDLAQKEFKIVVSKSTMQNEEGEKITILVNRLTKK